MESLVRRIRRIFSPERKRQEWIPTERYRRKMEQLERSLARWTDRKGWRTPDRNLGDAAQQLDTDTVTLYHYFEERVGMDFRTWRTRLRLEDAKRLLLEEPDRTAADIGRKAGFSNRSNFSRQFLAYTGLTPVQWRRRAGRSHDIPAPENDYV